jgi:hypothetical protein
MRPRLLDSRLFTLRVPLQARPVACRAGGAAFLATLWTGAHHDSRAGRLHRRFRASLWSAGNQWSGCQPFSVERTRASSPERSERIFYSGSRAVMISPVMRRPVTAMPSCSDSTQAGFFGGASPRFHLRTRPFVLTVRSTRD